MSETIYAGRMPILALRGLTVFPEQTVHFDVGRLKSVMAMDAAMKDNRTLLLVPQKDIQVDDPGLKDMYAVGTIVMVKQVLKAQDENLRVLVTGLSRGRITELTQNTPYLAGYVESIPAGDSPNTPEPGTAPGSQCSLCRLFGYDGASCSDYPAEDDRQ